MLLTLSDDDLFRMKAVVLDADREEAFKLIKEFVKRLQIQAGQGLKSHLDGN
jgi:hypothetical protein